MEWFMPINCLRKKKVTPFEFFSLSSEFPEISVPFVHTYTYDARLLTVVLLRENAKDLARVVRKADNVIYRILIQWIVWFVLLTLDSYIYLVDIVIQPFDQLGPEKWRQIFKTLIDTMCAFARRWCWRTFKNTT